MSRKILSAHNKKVLGLAKRYKSYGWKVKAAVKGFKHPRKIRNRIPDLTASKGRKQRIIEMNRVFALRQNKANFKPNQTQFH